MAIITLDGASLAEDLIWEDEFSWSGIEQSTQRTLSGKLLIWEGQIIGGRPITLSGEEDSAWMTRQELLALQEKADVIGAVYTLVYNGVSYTVKFRRDVFPVQALQIKPSPDHENDDRYGNIKIYLMEVA